jgi:hypothetical protein
MSAQVDRFERAEIAVFSFFALLRFTPVCFMAVKVMPDTGTVVQSILGLLLGIQLVPVAVVTQPTCALVALAGALIQIPVGMAYASRTTLQVVLVAGSAWLWARDWIGAGSSLVQEPHLGGGTGSAPSQAAVMLRYGGRTLRHERPRT